MGEYDKLLKLLDEGDYDLIRKDKRNRLPVNYPFRIVYIEFRFILKNGHSTYNWCECSPVMPLKGQVIKRSLFIELAKLAYDELNMDNSLTLVKVKKVTLISESLPEAKWKKYKPLLRAQAGLI